MQYLDKQITYDPIHGCFEVTIGSAVFSSLDVQDVKDFIKDYSVETFDANEERE